MKRQNVIWAVSVVAVCFAGVLTVAQSADGVKPAEPVAVDGPIRDLSGFRVDERRELEALASRTLAWLTGSSEQNDYIAVGRLAHYFGFVKFRVESGNSVTRSGAAQETYTSLTRAQREQMHELVEAQRVPFERVVAVRIEMNRLLDQLRSGEAVDPDAFLKLGERYGQAEAELGSILAAGLGEVAHSLSEEQKTTLADMRRRYVSGQAGRFKMPADAKNDVRRLDRASTQELWNVTSRLLTWVTGTPEDNDFETVGKPSQHFGFVSLRVESGHAVKRGAIAKEVLALLTPQQRSTLEQAVHTQRSQFDGFLQTRSRLCRELERALKNQDIRAHRVAAIGREMGRLEAQMTWAQANGILALRDQLTQQQAEALLAMRAKYVPTSKPERTDDPADLEPSSLQAERITRGRQLFAQCAMCHVAPRGARATAPSLNDLFERRIATDPEYSMYSPGLRRYAQNQNQWNDDRLNAFLRSPRDEVPGTIMGFNGIANKADREALISYMKTLSE